MGVNSTRHARRPAGRRRAVEASREIARLGRPGSPKGDEIRVASNKTIVGGGFFLNGVSNVIIRNLTIRDTRPRDRPSGTSIRGVVGSGLKG
ncbi:hypothetical protein ACBR40_07290 [Nonomuraea sp. AD125B]|uniref:hypothetical protein n=1 Tax=Nonomuraea sp. AD125B TaxID=3242897 RepID=UPI0035276154